MYTSRKEAADGCRYEASAAKRFSAAAIKKAEAGECKAAWELADTARTAARCAAQAHEALWAITNGELTDEDRRTVEEFCGVKAEVEKLLDTFHFRDAQKEAMNLARIGNKYLADAEPWKVIKTDPERVKTILNLSLQLTANLAIAFEPFLPFSSERLRQMLGMEKLEWERLGSTDLLPAGHQLGEPELLFQKIDDATIQAQLDKLAEIKRKNEEENYVAKPVKENISIDDFQKLDLRVGTVLRCERLKKNKKLLRFDILDAHEAGGKATRQILSGIALQYDPEELVGKQVVYIANLPARTFKIGSEEMQSEGMILSALNYDGQLSVITTTRKVQPGSEVC